MDRREASGFANDSQAGLETASRGEGSADGLLHCEAVSQSRIPVWGSSCHGSLEVEPGSQAQVDFGYVGMMVDPLTKRLRKSWVFLMTLSYSRHRFVRFVFRQDSRRGSTVTGGPSNILEELRLPW